MLIARIEQATRAIGAPSDWDGKDMSCNVLPIRDVKTHEGNFMVSAWEPTPEELAALLGGATVKLWIRGHEHPVVAMSVGAVIEGQRT